MQLLRSEDPRDRLERATRDELVEYAKRNGQADISEHMPVILIRQLLRQRGLTSPNIPNRPLGGFKSRDMYGLKEDGQDTKTVSAEDVLIADWKKQIEQSADPDTMTMGELRKECKRLGIKMVRTDNLETLKAKLRGQNAA